MSPARPDVITCPGPRERLSMPFGSVRQISHMNAVWQTQVELYFSLLITPTGEPVTETFDEIADEFPEEMIREIVKKIDEAIRPNYKDTKKN